MRFALLFLLVAQVSFATEAGPSVQIQTQQKRADGSTDKLVTCVFYVSSMDWSLSQRGPSGGLTINSYGTKNYGAEGANLHYLLQELHAQSWNVPAVDQVITPELRANAGIPRYGHQQIDTAYYTLQTHRFPDGTAITDNMADHRSATLFNFSTDNPKGIAQVNPTGAAAALMAFARHNCGLDSF